MTNEPKIYSQSDVAKMLDSKQAMINELVREINEKDKEIELLKNEKTI